jgi:hypothetical protein
VHAIAHMLAPLGGFAEWLAGAALHGVLGIAIGLALMPVVNGHSGPGAQGGRARLGGSVTEALHLIGGDHH